MKQTSGAGEEKNPSTKKINPIFAVIPGLLILGSRTLLGFADGSSLLGFFGLWSIYTWISAGLKRNRMGSDQDREISSDTSLPAAGLKILAVFSILTSTFCLGMLLEGAKELFRLKMGIPVMVPGVRSLVTIIVTTVLWEGGWCFAHPEVCGGKGHAALELFFSLIVFALLALLFIWAPQDPPNASDVHLFVFTESACGLTLSIALLIRCLSWLLGMGSRLLSARAGKTGTLH